MTQGDLCCHSVGRGLVRCRRRRPTSIRAGVRLGLGEITYTTTGIDNRGIHAADPDQHFFYEARIPIALFVQYWGNDFDVHWTTNYANDSLTPAVLDESLTEPGTLACRRRSA